MNVYVFPFVGRPFKGAWYYEWQLGPVVLQWKHDLSHVSRDKRGVCIGRFSLWLDKIWLQEIKPMGKGV